MIIPGIRKKPAPLLEPQPPEELGTGKSSISKNASNKNWVHV